MKIIKVLVNALVLLFFYSIIYSFISILLDVYFASTIEKKEVDYYWKYSNFIEYMVFFWFLYGLFIYPYLIFYRIILTNFNYKIAEKIIAGLIIGFMIGVIMAKYSMSFYIGELRPFKIIILYIIANTLIVIIDHIFFTKRNGKPKTT